ncbi:MAG: NAD(P)-dependent alcohol dehydrogenase [Sphingobacteriaceae bacterium]|nr:NAD(P)-dependent alcohol dehydrogenase [Sphingobacteriaceae bacterium]
MKAAIYKNYGPPEVVQLVEVEKPSPKNNEVLIKVHASTVNRTDTGFRSAEYFISRFWSGLLKPKNQILGNEFAGEIESVGKDVKLFKVGVKVFGYNDKTFGAHAEYMVMDEQGTLTTMPEHISFEEAAAITEGAHYALCDIRAAKIKEGQSVLINGTTGAIGSAAVQIIKHLGAEVVAVCDTKNVELVKSLGADMVIDYKKEDFTKLNRKFDVVFDAVGKSSFGKCKPLLKEKGIYMSTELGYMAQNPFLAMITPLIGGKKLLFPIPTISKEDVNYLKDLVVTGKLKPVIDKAYSLNEIVEAHKYVETGMKTGNVIINIIKRQ